MDDERYVVANEDDAAAAYREYYELHYPLPSAGWTPETPAADTPPPPIAESLPLEAPKAA